MDISIRTDEQYVYVDCSDAVPKEEVFLQINSKPVPPNADTQGAGVSVHKTATAEGNCHFKIIRSALLVDPSDGESTFPREITVSGAIASEIVTA